MNLTELSLEQLCQGYRKKDFSVTEVTKAYIKNIEEKDGEINAYITKTNDLALKRAKELDEGNFDLPLYGIPLSLKDNISLKDVRMTCGSKMLENYISPYDSSVSKKVKEAGAVILGKTNMDEFAMGATTRSSYFGYTKNPLNTKLVPGGSSGGSAASVASNTALVSVGTDTGGSTRQPASYCGIVGIKPTYGSISRYGISTMANTFDSPGTMGHSVEDATSLLKILVGRDKLDETSLGNEAIEKIDLKNLDETYLKNKKIAIPKIYMEMDLKENVMSEFERAIKKFQDLGGEVEIIDLPYLKYVIETYHILVNGEIAPNMARFDGLRFGHRTKEYGSIEEMYRKSRGEGFGKEVKKRIMIGTHILSLDLAEDYYYKALKVRGLIKRDMDMALKNHDFILSPTSPILPFELESNMSSVEIYQADMFTIPANMAGCPSLSVPMPIKNGLSVGIELTGKRFEDDVIINCAHIFERSFK